ncbi:MAG: putative tRNA/rRNA methyltransferase [Alphaproteobacteria bacterium MarineAlpha2_Bin1]|nr:MAG: putative tRNA/rRNA methyltransferase [Alphaproteobacteria bacterium MarineAlpha2_Bin1]
MNRVVDPIIILVQPQLGENIGAAARAMLNCGLTRLRIVNPRDGWPNSKAVRSSSGAESIIYNAGIYKTLLEALSDLNFTVACTSRKRNLRKKQFNIDDALNQYFDNSLKIGQWGIIFGSESSGLKNEDLDYSDVLLSIPSNESFGSFNLSHAVLIICFHWMRKIKELSSIVKDNVIDKDYLLASKSDLSGFFLQLENELEKGGFLYPPEKAPKMIKNLRAIFLRSKLSKKEVKTLRGVINALKRSGMSL